MTKFLQLQMDLHVVGLEPNSRDVFYTAFYGVYIWSVVIVVMYLINFIPASVVFPFCVYILMVASFSATRGNVGHLSNVKFEFPWRFSGRINIYLQFQSIFVIIS